MIHPAKHFLNDDQKTTLSRELMRQAVCFENQDRKIYDLSIERHLETIKIRIGQLQELKELLEAWL